MTFPLSFAERLYGLVMLTYPRAFRLQYETEMRLVFRELLNDRDVSRWQIVRMMVVDAIAGLVRPERIPSSDAVKHGVLFGLMTVAFSIAAQAWHPGAYVGVPLVPVPFLAFLFAAFWGARRTRSFGGGMTVALVMGAISSTMLLWDKLLFGLFPFYSVYDFALNFAMVASFCLVPGLIGAIAGTATAPHEESAS